MAFRLITNVGPRISGASGHKRQSPIKGAKINDSLEKGFMRLWLAMKPDLPVPKHNYRFCERRWTFDFAWPTVLAVEIDGLKYGVGGHQSSKGHTNDCSKDRAAMKLGWRVLRYTSMEWNERPVQIIEEVAKILQEVLDA
jgi:hypothetical protein